MPPVDLPGLLDVLMRAGPAMPGGMGEVPLTALELQAWATGAGVTLTPWEFETILDASKAYCQQRAISADPACPAPWLERPLDKAAVSKAIKSMLRA